MTGDIDHIAFRRARRRQRSAVAAGRLDSCVRRPRIGAIPPLDGPIRHRSAMPSISRSTTGRRARSPGSGASR